MMTQTRPYANTPLEVKAREWARQQMSPERFRHTEGVVETVTQLAEQHGIVAIASLRLAGWIHDAAKEWPDEALLRRAEEAHYPLRPIEQQAPSLLHGVVGALLAQEALGLDDPVVFSAAAYHTTGHPDMSRTDKAFYLADLIEPSRPYAWIAHVRELAAKDLDTALLFAVAHQMRRLLKHGIPVDPRSVDLYNRLLMDGNSIVPRDRA